MSNINDYLEEQKVRLQKALAHLDYSYKKVQALPIDLTDLDEETLETWESFAARFGRVADIFMMKYLRGVILQQDPGFSGTLRDNLNLAEKMGLIDNVKTWLAIRELRNISAHEYTDKDLTAFFKRLRDECPVLLSIKKRLS